MARGDLRSRPRKRGRGHKRPTPGSAVACTAVQDVDTAGDACLGGHTLSRRCVKHFEHVTHRQPPDMFHKPNGCKVFPQFGSKNGLLFKPAFTGTPRGNTAGFYFLYPRISSKSTKKPQKYPKFQTTIVLPRKTQFATSCVLCFPREDRNSATRTQTRVPLWANSTRNHLHYVLPYGFWTETPDRQAQNVHSLGKTQFATSCVKCFPMDSGPKHRITNAAHLSSTSQRKLGRRHSCHCLVLVRAAAADWGCCSHLSLCSKP